jgi:hypothetical protein
MYYFDEAQEVEDLYCAFMGVNLDIFPWHFRVSKGGGQFWDEIKQMEKEAFVNNN